MGPYLKLDHDHQHASVRTFWCYYNWWRSVVMWYVPRDQNSRALKGCCTGHVICDSLSERVTRKGELPGRYHHHHEHTDRDDHDKEASSRQKASSRPGLWWSNVRILRFELNWDHHDASSLHHDDNHHCMRSMVNIKMVNIKISAHWPDHHHHDQYAYSLRL